MPYPVEIKDVPEQPIAVIRGRAKRGNLPARIRALFDQFYADYKGKEGLNVVLYTDPGVPGEFDIACGVQVDLGGNAVTPAGTVVKTVYLGPYAGMKKGHDAIHAWARVNGCKLSGTSWEVYGHWNDDPAQLRTDIFYLLA